MSILNELRARFADALADFTDDPAPFADMVKPSQGEKFGDYQANCAMPLAKQSGVNPRDLALRLVDKLQIADLCEPPEIAGPGFINLTMRPEVLADAVNQMAGDPRLGVAPTATPRSMVIDFSSPNVAKPMHVGHLRSTVIGDALARICRFLGHDVTTDNHIGDWGTQFGMIIYGFKNFVNPKAYQADPVSELARLYRLVNQLSDYHQSCAALPALNDRIAFLDQAYQRMLGELDPSEKKQQKALKKQKADLNAATDERDALQRKIDAVESDRELHKLAKDHPEIATQARQETAKLHAGDLDNRRLWEEFLPACLSALQRIYDRLGISFDHTLGESFYDPMLAKVAKELEKQGLAKESDGALCVFVPGHTAPFIVRKADGAYTYATTDLATIRYRLEEFKADTMIYVVDARQSEHFQMLFDTAAKWEERPVELRHVSFGMVLGKDGRPYKTRSGDTVGLESLLDEAVTKAREIVAENDDQKSDADGNPRSELSEELRDRIAEMVGIGGLKYADLRHNRESDYIFDAEKMLAKTGDTATYMQYAFARVQGIFRKGGILPAQYRAAGHAILLAHPQERTLALKLCRYGEALEAVATDYRPNLLTQYLFELANELTTFYDQCPVLKADSPEIRDSRLMLCDLSGRIIEHGLSLLGIEAPHQM